MEKLFISIHPHQAKSKELLRACHMISDQTHEVPGCMDSRIRAGISATTGAIAGGAKQNQQQQQQQAANQQAQSQQQAQIDHFNKAKGVCLEGRGYTVK